MTRQRTHSSAAGSGVSVAFVLAATPTRAGAFRAAMTAVLHAGFSFGREPAGHIVYSYDLQGEQYAPPTIVPAGSITSLMGALDCLQTVEQHYNQSVGLALASAATTVPVTGRVYDEPNTIIMTLDLDAQTWRQFVALHRATRTASVALLDVGRTLFTLLPTSHLLIGPSALVRSLPTKLSPSLLGTTPITMIADAKAVTNRPSSSTALHVEELPRGHVIVRHWDVSQRVPAKEKARPRSSKRV